MNRGDHAEPRRFNGPQAVTLAPNSAYVVERIRRVLTALQDARSPRNLDLPGWRLHQLKGDRRGQWSGRVSGNWRIVFRFADGEAVDVDLIDYH